MNDENGALASTSNRRAFLAKTAALGISGAAGGTLLGAAPALAARRDTVVATNKQYKMVLIQIQPQSVPTAWFKGIQEVTSVQNNVKVSLLDGQNSIATQISLMDTAIQQGVNVIFLQPADSVAIGPSIKKAQAAGIPVITLNIDANQAHAAHVTMNHYYDAMAVAQTMGKMMGGKGNVVIINAPPGIIIRDQRTNGFTDGLKKYWPNIKVVANQNANWQRSQAQNIFRTMLAANPNITGVYGVNDDMALGAVDVAVSKGIIKKLAIFGNDGESAALTSIGAGQLTGTAYTDVWQQGRLAAAAAIVMTTGGANPSAFKAEANLLMPYTIVTKANVASIPKSARW